MTTAANFRNNLEMMDDLNDLTGAGRRLAEKYANVINKDETFESVVAILTLMYKAYSNYYKLVMLCNFIALCILLGVYFYYIHTDLQDDVATGKAKNRWDVYFGGMSILNTVVGFIISAGTYFAGIKFWEYVQQGVKFDAFKVSKAVNLAKNIAQNVDST